jgi:DNA (cytosine-5)-methyltransferase 1
VRAKGLEPSFPDLTPEFLRVIEEARPRWFLRENVPRAPEIKPAGYDVASFMLDHSALDSGDGIGHRQIRKRRFWFGVRDGSAPELRAHLVFALSPAQEPAKSLCGDSRSSFIPGGQAEVDAIKRGETVQREKSDVRYSLDNMLDLQGLPRDIFEHSPLTMGGKRKLIGNAVPLPMAEALACAVRDSMEQP